MRGATMFQRRVNCHFNPVHKSAYLLDLLLTGAVLSLLCSIIVTDAFQVQTGVLSRPTVRLVTHRYKFSGDQDAPFAGDADPVESIAALDTLVPRTKITPLIKSKSNLQGTKQVLWHLALFGMAAVIPNDLLSNLSMAFVSAFFFNGLHETIHRTAFRSRFANNVWSQIFGFITLRPARHYFYYHWQHHKYTGNRKLDSELQSGSFLDLPIETPLGYLAYISGVPFWVDAISSIARHALGICPEIYLTNDKARQQVTVEARAYLVLYGIIFAVASHNPTIGAVLYRYWMLPALLGQPFLRFYLLAEHRGRFQSPLIYENTRTMDTNWFFRKLAWYMPYHVEHHAWPSVPFHRLKDAHRLLVEATDDDLLDRGEVVPDLIRTRGYIAFNLRYLKRLFKEGKAKSTSRI